MHAATGKCALLSLLLCLLSSIVTTGAAFAAPAGDAGKGGDVFAQECSDCHSVKPGKNKKGPSLFGVVGRESAVIADFDYSEAMRALKATWSEENLDAYIAKPKAVVAAGKMKYDGLPDAQARADLIAYLASQK